jgi:peptidoglycan hydrolase-like protein with peptidoglycan-binding domain
MSLEPSGDYDPLTARYLSGYRYELGERLLYCQEPRLRGRDVAELQASLAQLGFDPAIIDGEFGPETERAVRDFQVNCGLDASGTLTRSTLTELKRLRPSVPKVPIAQARESGLLQATAAGPCIAIGGLRQREALTDASVEGSWITADSIAELIERANDEHVALAVWFTPGERLRVSYFAGPHSFSTTGFTLASDVARDLDAELHGTDDTFLRRTKMTALVITVRTDDDVMKVCGKLFAAIANCN